MLAVSLKEVKIDCYSHDFFLLQKLKKIMSRAINIFFAIVFINILAVAIVHLIYALRNENTFLNSMIAAWSFISDLFMLMFIVDYYKLFKEKREYYNQV